jgi:membrane associated rhomboid family serine protease
MLPTRGYASYPREDGMGQIIGWVVGGFIGFGIAWPYAESNASSMGGMLAVGAVGVAIFGSVGGFIGNALEAYIRSSSKQK